MMYNRSTKLGLTNLEQVNSFNWRQPEAANQIWVANPTMLTRKVFSETIRVLPAKDIHDLINELIEELDCRSGDPDVEAEPIEDDDEAEAEVAEDDDESEPEPVEDDEVLESPLSG